MPKITVPARRRKSFDRSHIWRTTTRAADCSGPPPTGGSQAAGESPAHAARRAAEGDGGRPELAVLGAFAGAFVAAKILGRLTGGRG